MATTSVASPFPAIGHTRHHSWGITMFVNDDIDLYAETIEGDQVPLWWPVARPHEIRTETIEVAGSDDVTFELRKTHHGPLIDDDRGHVVDIHAASRKPTPRGVLWLFSGPQAWMKCKLRHP